jgi:hypothetical protein
MGKGGSLRPAGGGVAGRPRQWASTRTQCELLLRVAKRVALKSLLRGFELIFQGPIFKRTTACWFDLICNAQRRRRVDLI